MADNDQYRPRRRSSFQALGILVLLAVVAGVAILFVLEGGSLGSSSVDNSGIVAPGAVR